MFHTLKKLPMKAALKLNNKILILEAPIRYSLLGSSIRPDDSPIIRKFYNCQPRLSWGMLSPH